MQIFYRYGYTHYLHVNDFAQRKVKYMWQDVICQYWPWAEKAVLSFPAALEMKPCLPAMHAKAHTWHCQVCMYMLMLYLIHCFSMYIIFRYCGVDVGKTDQLLEQGRTWSRFLAIYPGGT